MGYIPPIKDEQPMIYANRQAMQKPAKLTLDGVYRPEFQDVLEEKNPYGNYFMRYEQIAKHKLQNKNKSTAVYASNCTKKKQVNPEAVREMESRITRKGSFIDHTI
ncbi:hypothetical protein [Alkalicoccus daliensis]|uniref:Uncharacterized protein n=1 Tax=Alkalicoccus daliensis TaxID=745820 RepID=A0A1G9ZGX5_9BACI|nr:hypothetical protein [Alkalicoccus daliensis]SDN20504.1 hypothetical protein SAMN04488053_10197 [Alkalicoccus daliensis]